MGQLGNPSDEYIDLLAEDIPEVAEWVNAKAEERLWKGRVSDLGNQIKVQIGENKGLKAGKHIITWPRTTSASFNTTKFKAENPDVYNEYTETKPKDGGLRLKIKED